MKLKTNQFKRTAMFTGKTKPKYKAFISYKHSEKGRIHATALEKGLKSYARPLFQRPIKIFRDEHHMVPSNNLSQLIRDGLEQSEYLIFMAEQEAATSPWCQHELEYWCNELGRTDQLIIMHIGDKIELDLKQNTIHWEQTTALPSLLKNHLPAIPLYLDVNWAKDHRDVDLSNTKYRKIVNLVLSKLNGILPEELSDKELQIFKKNIRIRNLAIGLLSTLLVISIATAVFAYQKQKQASESAIEATMNAQKAKEKQLEATKNEQLANEQKKRAILASDSLRLAQKETLLALQNEAIQRERANLNAREATLQAEEAEAQKQIAFLAFQNKEKERERAEKSNRANQNAKLVYQLMNMNPTLAIRIADYNLKNHPEDPLARRARYDIIRNQSHNFYEWEQNICEEEIDKLLFTPDGKTIIAGINEKIYLLDDKGNIKFKFPKDNYSTHEMLLLPDGKSLLTGASYQDTIKRYDLKGKVLQRYKKEELQVESMALSSDGKMFLIGDEKGYVSLWTIAGEKLFKVMAGREVGRSFRGGERIRAMKFSPDNNTFLVASEDLVQLWSIDGNRLSSFKVDQIAVVTATFAPDGKSIFTGGNNGALKQWSLDGELIKTFPQSDHYISSIVFFPDGKRFLIGGMDYNVTLWNMNGDLEKTFVGHKSPVNTISIAPDQKSIISGSMDNTIKSWNLSGILQATYNADGPIGALKFNSKTKQLLTASHKRFKFWDFDGQGLAEYEGTGTDMYNASFSEDLNEVFLYFSGRKGMLMNILSQEKQIFETEAKYITAFTMNDSTRTIVTGYHNGEIKLWDMLGVEKKRFTAHEERISEICVSSDGKTIISGAENKMLKIWDQNGNLINEMKIEGGIYSLGYAPNANQILISSAKVIIALDLTTFKKKIFPRRNNGCMVSTVSYFPDGKRFAAVCFDGLVHIWNMDGYLEQSIQHDELGARAIDISPDGQYILTGGRDYLAKLWFTTDEFLKRKVHTFSLETLHKVGVALEPKDLKEMDKQKEK